MASLMHFLLLFSVLVLIRPMNGTFTTGNLMQKSPSQTNLSHSNGTYHMSANATFWSGLSLASSDIALHSGLDDLGGLVPCMGPTPPPNLTFPIETVVQKLFAVDGPTTEAVLITDSGESWFWTTSTYPAATTLYTTWTRQQVPQLNPYAGDSRPCCGMCTVYVSLVDVYYWPVPGANTACLASTTATATDSTLYSALNQGYNNTVSTVVGPEGFTYTSPSIYVAYHDISASNRCGQVGPKHTSITLSFAPGQLSTYDYYKGIFYHGGGAAPRPLNISNLPCPPQSLLDAQESANEVGFMLPTRPGYAPIISPPPAIQNLEPAWRGCHSQFAFDPPKVLMPASVLVPSPTPADQAGPPSAPAKPSPTSDRQPVQTHQESHLPNVDPLPSATNLADPASSEDLPAVELIDTPPVSLDLSAPDTVADPSRDTDPKNSADNYLNPQTDNQDSSPNPSDPGDNPSIRPNTPPSHHMEPSPHASQAGFSIIQSPPAAFVIAGGDQTFTVLPKGVLSIAGTTIHPSDPAITVQGTPVSLGSSSLIVGSSTLYLPTRTADGVFTAAGVGFAPLGPGRILIDGETLSVGGPATTMSGIRVSLAPSGIFINGQMFASPTPMPEAVDPGRILTIAGQKVVRLSDSSAIINGMSFSINSPARTISGTTFSLVPNGFVMDSKTYAFPTPAPDATATPEIVFTLAGQTITVLGGTALVDGMLVSVNGAAATVSGTIISLASSSLMLDGHAYPFPTSVLSTAYNAVVVDGVSLSVGGPAMTKADITLTLASGNAGLYLIDIGTVSPAFSFPVIAGESVSLGALGKVLVGNSISTYPGGGVNAGDLGSLIMHGFGQPGATPTSSMAGGTVTNAAGNGTSTAGTLEFTGDASKIFHSHVMAAFGLAVVTGLLWA